METKKTLCYHPEGYWKATMNGLIFEQRDPAVMNGCACGQNMTCPACGFGWGTIPCRCTPLVKYSSPAEYEGGAQ